MFEALEPEDLRRHWPAMRPGLDIISANRREGWIAEDIFVALVAGTALAYLAYDGELVKGFVILTLSQGYSSKECHVWCAFSEGGREFTVERDAELPGIAKTLGCKYLTFFSERLGWEKVAPEMGWERVHTLYRKAVT